MKILLGTLGRRPETTTYAFSAIGFIGGPVGISDLRAVHPAEAVVRIPVHHVQSDPVVVCLRTEVSRQERLDNERRKIRFLHFKKSEFTHSG